MAPQADNKREVQPSDVLRCMVSILRMWADAGEPVPVQRLADLSGSAEAVRQVVQEMEIELQLAREQLAGHRPAPTLRETLAMELMREGTNVTPISRAFREVPLS